MKPEVNSISGRLSLRPPQRESLEILDRVCAIAPPRKDADVQAALEIIQSEFPGVTDFERDFPSLCFTLATGVGKTRLMGAFITYLHLAHGINNFFVLAPNLTIYDKLITDFTPNTPKYVFKGIAEFALNAPGVITGENYEQRAGGLENLYDVRINIFNISKINSEVRGGKAPRIKRLSEYIGESYFDYLAGLDDLVLLMDESHRYRASAGVKAINELKPVLGLELTATPMVEKGKKSIPFQNVIYDYPLRRAMEDGFVKEPAVATRENFSAKGMTEGEIERLKLEDGVRLHENTKVLLRTYATQNGLPVVKPFVLVIARDTTHAAALLKMIDAETFFEGRYRGRVIQVDSSTKEDEVIERLLKVESADEPTEIVIHVNMLKEGWDVTNLYTIVPLRAANARVLIEQTIGRGLRLPYGKRTGDEGVDRLTIVAHDKFQEIVDEARKDTSLIQMRQLILKEDDLQQQVKTVVSEPAVKVELGLVPAPPGAFATVPQISESERQARRVIYENFCELQDQPQQAPTSAALLKPEIQQMVARQVREQLQPAQLVLAETETPLDVEALVAETAQKLVLGNIDIPRITMQPAEETRGGFEPFTLDLKDMQYQAPSQNLWIQYLREGERQTLEAQGGNIREGRLEDYIVKCLIDFNDICYDTDADLLYDLASQTVRHLRDYLSDEDAEKVLLYHQRNIARFIHAEMQAHYREEKVTYTAHISGGFTALKSSGYTQSSKYPPRDFRQAAPNKNETGKYVFNGFERCLYTEQKFDSDSERQLAVILDREAHKWFRPAPGQFQIFYSYEYDQHQYEPDFVAETDAEIFMIEVKMNKEMQNAEVLAKKEAALAWCRHATDYTLKQGGKPWRYLLLPHHELQENRTLEGLGKLGA